MSGRALVDALTDAILAEAREWPDTFSAVHVSALAEPLTEGGSERLREVAAILAQHLVRHVEEAKLGRGRVTDRRLDQRLRKAVR